MLIERGNKKRFEEAFGPRFFIFELDDWIFTTSAAEDRLLKHFETKNLKGFGVQHLKLGIMLPRGDSVLSGPDPAYAYFPISPLYPVSRRIDTSAWISLRYAAWNWWVR